MQWAQTLLIIILTIVGIVVFIVLLIELINIPKPLVVPFADGTIVKIKSLANNLYLRPITCQEIQSCNTPLINNFCQIPGNGSIVVPIGQVDDPLTNWQLCQYSASSDQGQAKYAVYSQNSQGTFVLAVTNDILVLRQSPDICTVAKTRSQICFPNSNTQEYFSFVLDEKSSGVNTTSGSYNIISFCNATGNNYLVTDGQGAVSLPSNRCPPYVATQLGQAFGCPTPTGDPRCSLGYLFIIEVQS